MSLRVVKLQVTEASCEAYAKSENTADRRDVEIGRSRRSRSEQPSLTIEAILQSFENYDVAHVPLRSVESLDADYQPLIDIRKFPNQGDPDTSAVIGFSARILAKSGRLVASRVFLQSRKLDKVDPLSAVAAFNDAFDSITTELITWTDDAR